MATNNIINKTSEYFLGSGGTLANPTYSFSSDTNTGIWNSDIDTLSFISGGAIAFQVDQQNLTPVNYIRIRANSAGNPPIISATGTDSNINIQLAPKAGQVRNSSISSLTVPAYGNSTGVAGIGYPSVNEVSVVGNSKTVGNFINANASDVTYLTFTSALDNVSDASLVPKLSAAGAFTGVNLDIGIQGVGAGAGLAVLSDSTGTNGGSIKLWNSTNTFYTYIIPTAGISADNTLTLPSTTGTLAITAGASIPSLVQGDLLYASGTNALSALNKNTSATRYLSNTGTSNNPAWAQVNLANGVTGITPVANGGTGTSTVFSTGKIVFASASGGQYTSDASFHYDTTNKRLGVGTASPATGLGVTTFVINGMGTSYNTNAYFNYVNGPVNLVLGGYWDGGAQENPFIQATDGGSPTVIGTTPTYLAINPLGGTVGIGTPLPSSTYTLDVRGNTSGVRYMAQFDNTDTGNSAEARIVFSQGVNNFYQGIGGAYNTGAPYMSFSVNTSANTWSEKMRIASDGMVSISHLSLSGDMILTATIDTSSGTINSLAHPTSLVILTSNSAITLNGIVAGTEGQIVYVLRSGFGSNITLNHVSGSGSAKLILPNGGSSITVTDRAGFMFVYYSTFWYLISR